MPSELKVTAVDENGEIMAIEHERFEVHGLQFHPESIMTPDGYQMLENFLAHAAKRLSKTTTTA